MQYEELKDACHHVQCLAITWPITLFAGLAIVLTMLLKYDNPTSKLLFLAIFGFILIGIGLLLFDMLLVASCSVKYCGAMFCACTNSGRIVLEEVYCKNHAKKLRDTPE